MPVYLSGCENNWNTFVFVVKTEVQWFLIEKLSSIKFQKNDYTWRQKVCNLL